jgi:uncharacterized protein YndB with AHSA1/START domain
VSTVERTRLVPAPVDEVWATLSAFAEIARWAPQIEHACLLDAGPVGVGTSRRVQVGRLTLVERIIEWDPPRTLAYRIEGLPPAAGTVTNRWDLAPDDGGTRAVLTTTIDAGRRPPQRLVARVLGRRLGAASEALLAGLAARHHVPEPTP